MDNVNLKYKIEILQGKNKGKVIELETSVEELEEYCISDLLIDEDHLDSYGNQTEHYRILEREIL